MKIFATILILCCLGACKKTVQRVQENYIVSAMTSGQWKVSSYLKGSIDTTSAFTNYQFQFKANNTVDAVNNSVLINTGTWSGNMTDGTISANFVNAPSPLPLLNGQWKITNSTQVSVEAYQIVNGELRKLKLNKV
ncbi:MAG: hypothetical protein NVS1B13_15580 [Flavisolibacter sp.]